MTSAPDNKPYKAFTNESINKYRDVKRYRGQAFLAPSRAASFLIVLGLLLSLTFCGSKTETSDDEFAGSDTGTAKTRASRRGAAPPILPASNERNFIRNVSISPYKVSAGTEIKVSMETAIPRDMEHEISFIYYKNGEQLIETDKNTLAPSLFRKNDLVYAAVVLTSKGKIIEKALSEPIVIANTSPIITAVNLPEIHGPGTYFITFKAEDIDGDILTYSLLPTEEDQDVFDGLKINPQDGTITLTLGEKAPPENMMFVISADDRDGGVTKKIVTLPFEITIKPPEQTSEENQ